MYLNDRAESIQTMLNSDRHHLTCNDLSLNKEISKRTLKGFRIPFGIRKNVLDLFAALLADCPFVVYPSSTNAVDTLHFKPVLASYTYPSSYPCSLTDDDHVFGLSAAARGSALRQPLQL